MKVEYSWFSRENRNQFSSKRETMQPLLSSVPHCVSDCIVAEKRFCCFFTPLGVRGPRSRADGLYALSLSFAGASVVMSVAPGADVPAAAVASSRADETAPKHPTDWDFVMDSSTSQTTASGHSVGHADISAQGNSLSSRNAVTDW